ncbi:MAG: hypothetical protein KF760_02270 [Candidatus Eremiobacteraeota bacterium]|nr:hypothetical protein [Candidatus Eremiobacteraeota bacterium]MCW5868863.1 hypothetical protein [Candidatus Eremiobacteraeota bacterium]
MEILDLFDSARQRAIPVGLYPYQGEFQGWLFFSVGFGGGRAGYGYLGRAWSRLGFQVAVIEHVGSNADILKAIHQPGMRQAELAEAVGRRVRDQAELEARPQDLAYVRRVLSPGSGWAGLAGHSFGSYTALATLGVEALLPEGPQSWEFGLDWAGVVLMSAQPPDSAVSRRGLSGLHLPAFLLTGTQDSGMPAGVTFEQRLTTYDAVPAGRKALAVLEGADHMAFAGIGLAVAPALETIAQLTGEFWLALRQQRPIAWPESLPVGVDLRVG